LSRANEITRQAGEVRTLTPADKDALLQLLRFPELEERQMAIKDAFETTCEWFLQTDQYRCWADPSTNRKERCAFLSVNGEAGSGKSTLMKFLFNHHSARRPEHHAIAYFPTSQGSEGQKTAKGAYRSFLVQILRGMETVRCGSHVLDQLIKCGQAKMHTASLRELLEHLVPQFGRPIYLFVDALDECLDSDVRDITACLGRLVELCAKKKMRIGICVSSKPGSDLTNSTWPTVVLEKQDGHSKDINKYTEHSLRIPNRSLAREVQQELSRKACGSFLWATLAIGMLNTESEYAVKDRLEVMPSGLCELYHHFVGQSRDETGNGLLCCIESLLHSRDSPTAIELYYVILEETNPQALRTLHKGASREEQAVQHIRKTCKGLVEITGTPKRIVRFTHRSVPDFFHSEKWTEKIRGNLMGMFGDNSHDRLKKHYRTMLDVFTPQPLETTDRTRQLNTSEWHSDQHILAEGHASSYYSRGVTDHDASQRQVPARHEAYEDNHVRGSMKNSVYDATTGTVMRSMVQKLLYYANEAAKDGVDQLEFLQDFPLSQYVEAVNSLSHQRTYSPNVSLLYILFHRNMAHLVAAHPGATAYLEPEHDAGGTPFLAALAEGSYDTIRKIFQLQAQWSYGKQSTMWLADEVCENYVQVVKEHQEELSHHLNGWKDGTLTDYYAVVSYMMQPGNEILYLYLLLVGVVDPDRDDTTLLFLWSAQQGLVDVMQFLIETRRIDFDNDIAFKALTRAAERNHESVVTMLLKASPDLLEKQDEHGRRPLSVAVINGHPEVTGLLLEHGANVETKDYEGRSPLALAALSNSLEVLTLILSCGHIEIDNQDDLGRSPLSLAIETSRLDMLATLCRAGGEPDIVDIYGRTALSYAAEKGLFDISEYLVEACGADQSVKDNYEWLPLHYTQQGLHRSLDAHDDKKIKEFKQVIMLFEGKRSQIQGAPGEILVRHAEPSFQPAESQPTIQTRQTAFETTTNRYTSSAPTNSLDFASQPIESHDIAPSPYRGVPHTKHSSTAQCDADNRKYPVSRRHRSPVVHHVVPQASWSSEVQSGREEPSHQNDWFDDGQYGHVPVWVAPQVSGHNDTGWAGNGRGYDEIQNKTDEEDADSEYPHVKRPLHGDLQDGWHGDRGGEHDNDDYNDNSDSGYGEDENGDDGIEYDGSGDDASGDDASGDDASGDDASGDDGSRDEDGGDEDDEDGGDEDGDDEDGDDEDGDDNDRDGDEDGWKWRWGRRWRRIWKWMV
jgi:hypothetical protein